MGLGNASEQDVLGILFADDNMNDDTYLNAILRRNDQKAWKRMLVSAVGEEAIPSVHNHAFAKMSIMETLLSFIQDHRQERTDMVEAFLEYCNERTFMTQMILRTPLWSGPARYVDYVVLEMLRAQCPKTAGRVWNTLKPQRCAEMCLEHGDVETWEQLWMISDDSMRSFLRQTALSFEQDHPETTVVERLPSMTKEALEQTLSQGHENRKKAATKKI